MIQESIIDTKIAPRRKLYRFGLKTFLALARITDTILVGVGVIALFLLWAFVNQQRVQMHGHYEAWLYQQVCPVTMATATKQSDAGKPVALPPPDPFFGSQRFYLARTFSFKRKYEQCVAENKS
jgi:hypothetical protein